MCCPHPVASLSPPTGPARPQLCAGCWAVRAGTWGGPSGAAGLTAATGGECRDGQPLSLSLERGRVPQCGIWPREHPGEQVGSTGRMEAPRVAW